MIHIKSQNEEEKWEVKLPLDVLKKFRQQINLSDETISNACERRGSKLIAYFTIDILLLVISALVAESYSSIYLISLMIIGARLVGIASAGVHDGTHGTLFENKGTNDKFAKFTCLLAFIPFSVLKDYKSNHSKHHRFVNAGPDPSLEIFTYLNQLSNTKLFMILLSNLLGYSFVKHRIELTIKKESWQKDTVSLIWFLAVFILIIFFFSQDFLIAKLALYYWLIPIATWGQVVNLMRLLAEHYHQGNYVKRDRLNLPDVLKTRDVKLSIFDKVFIVTHNVNFHLTHHLYPQVPFYNLPELHREILKKKSYQEHAHCVNGYHNFLKEYLFDRNKNPLL